MTILYGLIVVFLVLAGIFASKVLFSISRRRYYQKQGIKFTRTYPFIGSEIAISDLITKNKTRDYLYVGDKKADLIGSIRGFDIQLYAVNRPTTDILINPKTIGTYIDRDTPALYSFGQLSPQALTFTPIRTEMFQERKANILRGFKLDLMDDVSLRLSQEYIADNAGGDMLDMRSLVASWTRDVMGEFVWGRSAMSAEIPFKDEQGHEQKVKFMVALNETFTRLRYYSNQFWNRVYFPFATWPVTKESRYLQFNIRSLQDHLEIALKEQPDPNSVSYDVVKQNNECGISKIVTRDDLLTISIAGLDTVQSMILATLFYLLIPENKNWKNAITHAADGADRERIVEACISEAIRIDPPGSVINNKVVQDFEFSVSGRQYVLKKGTRIMPNIHALHAEYGEAYDPGKYLDLETKKDLYVMPFGRGRRSCPGQTIGQIMATNFVREFITRYPDATIANREDANIRFNNISRSKLIVMLPRVNTIKAAE